MKKIFGFSLVEIVVALIIFSVITAALAPIITKKLKSTGITIGSGDGGSLKMNCQEFGPECSLCYPNKCVVCVKSCLETQALDIDECKCKDCNDTEEMFGPNCLKCDISNCSKCIATNYVNGGQCTICPIGSYCDGTSKKTCENGKYTDAEGQTSCKNCEAGYYCNKRRMSGR